MVKEIVICSIIIASIFALDYTTQNYTKNNINEVIEGLNNLQEDIRNNENKDKMEQKINYIKDNWSDMEEKFSYFLEHDELEKVDTEVKGLSSYIETGENNLALAEIEKAIFILEHIKEKNSFTLANVF